MRKIQNSTALTLFVLIVSSFFLSAEDIKDPRELFYNGQRALNEENPYLAIDFFRSALDINPQYADAVLGMASAHFMLGEYNKAYSELKGAALLVPGSEKYKLLLARTLTALGRYDEALSIYHGILISRPYDPDANQGAAEIYAIAGQKELADQYYRKTLKYSPGDRRVLLQLVILHDGKREKYLAESVLKEALSRYPDNLSVRIQAAKHYSVYSEWEEASIQLEKAKSLISSGPEDPRYNDLLILDAVLSLKKGDPAAAKNDIEQIQNTGQHLPAELFFIKAAACRELGQEEEAQRSLLFLLRENPNDEIARLFKEEYLIKNADGFETERSDSAKWHIDSGKRFEDRFFYERAYLEYRRARLIDKHNENAWISYIDILGKMGFSEKYANEIEAALSRDINKNTGYYSRLKRRLDSYKHTGISPLAAKWENLLPDLEKNKWYLSAGDKWKIGVFTTDNSNLLPSHTGAQETLAFFFADLLDLDPDISTSFSSDGSIARYPVINKVNDFSEAFRKARNQMDYFVIIDFSETERTFTASAKLYIASSGELSGTLFELQSGVNKVLNTISAIAADVSDKVPGRMFIAASEGQTVLLDKGSWDKIETGSEWIVIRKNRAVPAAGESPVLYLPADYLGTVKITSVSEPLSEGTYVKAGDFDFAAPGDQLFLLPVPEISKDSIEMTDPVLKIKLLSIP